MKWMILILVLGLASCFSKRKKRKIDTPRQQPNPTLQGPTFDPAQLQGRWLSQCKVQSLADEKYPARSELEINGSRIVRRTTYFSTKGCTSGIYKREVRADFVVGNPMVQNIREITFNNLNVTQTLLTTQLRTAFNQAGHCGVSNWQVGTASTPVNIECKTFSDRKVNSLKLEEGKLSFSFTRVSSNGGYGSIGDGIEYQRN